MKRRRQRFVGWVMKAKRGGSKRRKLTGGFAYGRVVHNANSSFSTGGGINIGGPPSVICTGPAICFGGSSSKVANGWTLGGGLEYAFWQRWMVKAEYLYVSLDSNSVTENALVTDPGAAPASLNASFGLTNFNVVRVGLNYQFH